MTRPRQPSLNPLVAIVLIAAISLAALWVSGITPRPPAAPTSIVEQITAPVPIGLDNPCMVLSALPLVLPSVFERKRRRKSRPRIRTRFGGKAIARAHEEPDAPAPEGGTDFAVLDQHGNPVQRANAGVGSDGQPLPVVRANAVTAQAAAVSPLLTNYANGYPQDNADQVVDFFAPRVPVPVIFQYRNQALANELGLEANDQIGYTGIPSVIHRDAESLTSGQLMFRGLETPLTEQDRRLADAMLGNSADQERQDRVRFLVGQIRRGRAYRVYNAIASAVGSATAVTIYTATDPFKALRTYLQNAILEAGSPEYVRVCMGYANLAGFQDHPLVNGASAGLIRDVPMAMIANKLGIPEKNLMTSYHQVVTTAQGKTASKSVLIGSTQFYIFVCRPTPDRFDNSAFKTFVLNGAGDFETYTHNPHPLYEQIGLKYWDLLKQTNTNTYAIQRLALTWSASAS